MTRDMVEVTRCADCANWHPFDVVDGVRYGECDEFSPKDHYERHATREDGYCFWAARRSVV